MLRLYSYLDFEHCMKEEIEQLRQSCSMEYMQINLTVFTNYFQVNTNQATMREQRTFIRPKCKTERCKDSFLLSYVYSS